MTEDGGARGRFAPSPTGSLHLGNLRTAMVAQLSIASQQGTLVLRFEDLDRNNSRREIADEQLADLNALGIDFAGPPVWQSDRFDLYDNAIAELADRGLTYECFCTRREISESLTAPHAPTSSYPGTCRDLSRAERDRRRATRPPAVRLRAATATATFHDRLHGDQTLPTDDVVLRRNDGVPSYNLAVVVDDALQGVTEVVRGDDLLVVTATQVLLQGLLGHPTPDYLHVPLVLGDDGARLSKRHGAVSLTDLLGTGWSPGAIRELLIESLGQRENEPFDVGAIPREPFVFVAQRASIDP